jgi:hypothetical protein
MNTPDGKVSEGEWNRFVNGVIVQKFPDGFTVLDAGGHWKSRTGTIIEEDTKMVQIIHKNGSESDKKIEEIIEEYKTRFSQEAVLRVRSCQEVKF